MKKRLLFLIIVSLFNATHALAQDGIFGIDSSVKPRHGFVIQANLAFDIPFADMAKRFGNNVRVGPALLYKTERNWLFGVKCDFLFGNVVWEDSLLNGVKDKYAGPVNGKTIEVLNQNGDRTNVVLFGRGYIAGVQVGKIFNTSHNKPDRGVTLLTTLGFLQHKINIFNRENDIPQLRGDYRKGYDRLTNGLVIEQFVGYSVFSTDGLLNFNIGVNLAVGFTQGRRDFLYDVRRPDGGQRTDVLLGIRGGWMIPLFKRKSEELVF